ncbi:MAG TPA: VOC family protein [bacterium]|nr:VOC family protein [bacterium]
MEQRLSLITLGVRDMARARRFYEGGLGWRPSSISSDTVAFYQVGGIALALYGEAALAQDAGLPPPGPTRPFRGMALAHNVPNPQLVDVLLAEVVRAGGRVVQDAQETEWGGYAGYFADPDGHLWEVAWNPGFTLEANGTLRLPE